MFITLALGLSLAADVLTAGKPAPAMSADSALKGAQVTSFEPGKVYVVEFWATWCPPCVATVPHLTKIQKQHPEATVIGVAGFERGKTGEEGEAAKVKKVKDFIATQGDKMSYTVLYDADGSMAKDWMTAARQNGIPCAFVVDGNGVITHIGLPDENLDKAVAGACEAAKARKAEGSSGSGGDGKKSSDSKTSSDSQKSSDSQSSSDSQKSSDSQRSGDSQKSGQSGAQQSGGSSGSRSGQSSGGSSSGGSGR